jgi:hypothetical protein
VADYTFVQSDTRPFFAVVIKNNITNAAVDLTGTTVTFYLRHKRTRTAKIGGAPCVLTDAVNGKVEYRWSATDLDVPGLYDAEFRIVHTDARPQRVRIDSVEILEKLF